MKSASAGTLRIEPLRGRFDWRAFHDLPLRLHASDPSWIPPLYLERKQHLAPAHNPYFAHAEVAYWLAWHGDACVGRISAQIDRLSLERHQDGAGHFGLLESIDDPTVFAGLFATAEAWLRARGMQRVRGPFNLSINQECGLLIEGFDTPPYFLMGHAPAYYGQRVSECGFAKAKDLIAYTYEFADGLPKKAQALLEKGADKRVGVRVRPLDRRHFERDLAAIVDIFNDAWSSNWGFVPFTDDEVRQMGKDLRPIVRDRFISIAEIDGEPVAMAVSLPNVNEAIADLNGRLLPSGWAKLLWRLKVRGTKSARLPLMGVRRRYHGTALGASLALSVIDALRAYHSEIGTERAELSWILEDNLPTRRMIELIGGRAYKTYRLYEKALA